MNDFLRSYKPVDARNSTAGKKKRDGSRPFFPALAAWVGGKTDQ
jgi:hypothetical protein